MTQRYVFSHKIYGCTLEIQNMVTPPLAAKLTKVTATKTLFVFRTTVISTKTSNIPPWN